MRKVVPGPTQESVWDYPRPPRVEAAAESVRVEFGERVVAATNKALRVLETSHPPVYYIPRDDIEPGVLKVTDTKTFCEFKGWASYVTLRVGDAQSIDAGWFYPEPAAGYETLRAAVAFYPERVAACYVGGERVTAQPGSFYGGWITSAVVGPFKGEPGTRGW